MATTDNADVASEETVSEAAPAVSPAGKSGQGKLSVSESGEDVQKTLQDLRSYRQLPDADQS